MLAAIFVWLMFSWMCDVYFCWSVQAGMQEMQEKMEKRGGRWMDGLDEGNQNKRSKRGEEP